MCVHFFGGPCIFVPVILVCKRDYYSNSLFQVLDGDEQQGIGFARNIAHFLPNHTTLIYNLGLGQYELQMVCIFNVGSAR